MWLGWIITPITIIAIHMILISINYKHIFKIWKSQRIVPLLSKQIEMEEFLSRCQDMLPGIKAYTEVILERIFKRFLMMKVTGKR